MSMLAKFIESQEKRREFRTIRYFTGFDIRKYTLPSKCLGGSLWIQKLEKT